MDNDKIRGADNLNKRIADIRKKLAVSDVVGDVGALLLRRTLDRFDREIDPDGQKWKPLKQSTLQRRSYAGASDKKMLVRTKTLRESIQIIKGGLNSTFSNTGAGLRIGVDGGKKTADGQLVAVYARIQNQQRRFLGVSRDDVRAIDELLRRRGNEAIE